MPDRTAVLSWDWRNQPDLDTLAEAIADLSDGRVHLHWVDTGSDDIVIVLADRALTDAEANDTYEQTYTDTNDKETQS